MHNDEVVVGKKEFQCSLNLSLNPTCDDSTGSNRIEKGKVMYLLDLFEERWKKGQCDLVCGVFLDDWAMLLYDDVLFTCDEDSFNSLGSWSDSNESVFWVHKVFIHSFIHSFIHLFIHSFVKCQLGDVPGI